MTTQELAHAPDTSISNTQNSILAPLVDEARECGIEGQLVNALRIAYRTGRHLEGFLKINEFSNCTAWVRLRKENKEITVQFMVTNQTSSTGIMAFNQAAVLNVAMYLLGKLSDEEIIKRVKRKAEKMLNEFLNCMPPDMDYHPREIIVEFYNKRKLLQLQWDNACKVQEDPVAVYVYLVKYYLKNARYNNQFLYEDDSCYIFGEEEYSKISNELGWSNTEKMSELLYRSGFLHVPDSAKGYQKNTYISQEMLNKKIKDSTPFTLEKPHSKWMYNIRKPSEEIINTYLNTVVKVEQDSDDALKAII